MTKPLSTFFVSLLLILLSFSNVFAVKHIVNVQNYIFVPANLPNVQVGDTIRWVWINGVHTTTSTTIPTGAIPWDAPITSATPFYEYRVAVAGVYNYLCTPHSSSQLGSFTATAPSATLSVTPANQNVSSTAGNTSFNVSSNSNWTATSNANWCTVTPSGSGNGSLIATYQSNPLITQRIATITISVTGLPATTVTVTQQGAQATLSVTPSNQSVTSSSGSTSFSVSSNTSWSASSDQGWCSVTSSGNGNGNIVASYDENTSSQQRVATISVVVSGLPVSTVTVTQAGAATLSVTPSNRDVMSLAGTTTFDVTSNAQWNAMSNQTWCTVTPSGNGNATLTATYQSNPTTIQRIATITVSAEGQPSSVVTVTQAGSAATLSVSPINRNVSADAGSTTFNITSNADWSAASNSDWCLVTTSGTGNAILTALYEANTETDQRVASITISVQGIPSQLVTVTQGGASTVLLLDPLNQDVTAQSGTATFNIISNTTWHVESNAAWASSTSDGSGNGLIVIEYEENFDTETRMGTFLVTAAEASQIISITQEGSVSVISNSIQGMKIFPNPSKGLIEISSDNPHSGTLQLISMSGKVMTTVNIQSLAGFTFDASSFAKGTYILKLEQDGNYYITRLVLVD